jgi:hypothetical protein
MRLSLILALIGLLVALVGAPSVTAAHRVAAAHECAD